MANEKSEKQPQKPPHVWVQINTASGKVIAVYSGGRIEGGAHVGKTPGKPGRKGKNDKTNNGKNIPKEPEDNQVLPVEENGTSDPCCYRDAGTGEEWCWC